MIWQHTLLHRGKSHPTVGCQAQGNWTGARSLDIMLPSARGAPRFENPERREVLPRSFFLGGVKEPVNGRSSPDSEQTTLPALGDDREQVVSSDWRVSAPDRQVNTSYRGVTSSHPPVKALRSRVNSFSRRGISLYPPFNCLTQRVERPDPPIRRPHRLVRSFDPIGQRPTQAAGMTSQNIGRDFCPAS
jgi:hypothetical protein